MPAVKTCAFYPCAEVDRCCLVGGCVKQRFPQQFGAASAVTTEPTKRGARKLAGTKPPKARAPSSRT